MASYIGGPLDGQPADYAPSEGDTYTARIELEFTSKIIRTIVAPYRYVGKDGNWVFDSYGKYVVEERPVVVDTEWGFVRPDWNPPVPSLRG